MSGYRSDEGRYRGEDYSPAGVVKGLWHGSDLYLVALFLAIPFVVLREVIGMRRAERRIAS